MTQLQISMFDYQQLDTETRIVVEQRAGEIKELMKRTAQDIIEIGEKLIDVKDRLPHGEFGGWLEAEFEWNERTAQRFMQVAENFKTDKLSDLMIAPSALYLLAAPSTPDEARQAAIERAQAGEQITYSAAKDIVNNYNGKLVDTPVEYRFDNYSIYASDPELDAALKDEIKPVCPDCGQIYDGASCPDCHKSTMKPKLNYKGDPGLSGPMDRCQTPAYAFSPLIDKLDKNWIIWEPARGEGYLSEAIASQGFMVVDSDLLTGQNFFEYEPDNWDCIVTNPAFSIKYDWLARCYELGKPFALLLPIETLGAKAAQESFKKYDAPPLQVIFLDRRVNFNMPNKGWDGSAAQFPVAWFTWKLNIEQQIMFLEMDYNNGV